MALEVAAMSWIPKIVNLPIWGIYQLVDSCGGRTEMAETIRLMLQE